MITKTIYSGRYFTLLYYGASLRVYIKKDFRGKGFTDNPYWTFGKPETHSVAGQLIGAVERACSELIKKVSLFDRESFESKILLECKKTGLRHRLLKKSVVGEVLVKDWYEIICVLKRRTLKESTFISKVEKLLHKKMQQFLLLELNESTIESVVNSIDYNVSDKITILGYLKEGLLLLPPSSVTDFGVKLIERTVFLTHKHKKKKNPIDWEKFAYSEEEVQHILDYLRACLEQDKTNLEALFFYSGFKTGMRIGELVGLQIWQVNLVRDEILISQQWNRVSNSITTTKTGRERTLRFGEELHCVFLESILRRKNTGRDTFVFGTNTAVPQLSKLYKFWTKLIADLRVSVREDFPFYKMSSFRHSFVTNQLRKNADPLSLAKAVGHSPKTALNHYRDFSDTEDIHFE